MMPRRINCPRCGKWSYEGEAPECDCEPMSAAEQLEPMYGNRKQRRTEWAQSRKMFRP